MSATIAVLIVAHLGILVGIVIGLVIRSDQRDRAETDGYQHGYNDGRFWQQMHSIDT